MLSAKARTAVNTWLGAGADIIKVSIQADVYKHGAGDWTSATHFANVPRKYMPTITWLQSSETTRISSRKHGVSFWSNSVQYNALATGENVYRRMLIRTVLGGASEFTMQNGCRDNCIVKAIQNYTSILRTKKVRFSFCKEWRVQIPNCFRARFVLGSVLTSLHSRFSSLHRTGP